MTRRLLSCLWMVACTALCASIVAAQGPAEPATEPSEAIVDSPAVAAIRAAEPSTPEELLRAVGLLVTLDRTDLARTYLERLQALNLDAAAKAQLHEEFGTGLMLRLSRLEPLSPLGGEFASSVLQAARQQATDPQRLSQLVSQLGDDSEARYRAAEQLLRAGPHAVPPLLASIAQGDSPAVQQAASKILAELGDAAVPPLSAYLSSSDVRQHALAVRLLGHTKSVRAMPYLVRPYFAADASGTQLQAATAAWKQVADRLPEQAAALQILTREAERAYAGATAARPDLDDEVESWTWSQEAQAAVPHRLLARDSAAVVAARHYGDLAAMQPEVKEFQRRQLISRLHVDQALGGLDQPLRRGEGSAYELARQAGPTQLQAVLAQSLRDGYSAAAMGAAEVLGNLGDRGVLAAAADRTAPLVQALNHSNRRVRFAAARAIVELQPEGPFAGASRLAEALGYFAGSQGKRLVLAAHPRRAVAQTLGGLLAGAGFDAQTATTGSELIRRAVRSPDIELLVVSDRLNPESLWSWLEELRADPLTAELPVAIVAGPQTLGAAHRVAEAHPRTLAFPQPTDSDTMLAYLPDLRLQVGRDLVDREERLQQALVALDGLLRLEHIKGQGALDLSRQQQSVIAALDTPELSLAAASVLARMGTPRAQQALLEFASQDVRRLAARQAAVEAFDRSVRSFGVLLTSEQIQRQHERYSQSRLFDAETQQILRALLDSIEDPRRDDAP